MWLQSIIYYFPTLIYLLHVTKLINLTSLMLLYSDVFLTSYHELNLMSSSSYYMQKKRRMKRNKNRSDVTLRYIFCFFFSSLWSYLYHKKYAKLNTFVYIGTTVTGLEHLYSFWIKKLCISPLYPTTMYCPFTIYINLISI